MQFGEWKANIVQEGWGDTVAVYLFRVRAGGHDLLGPDLVPVFVEEGVTGIHQPTFRLNRDLLQGIADALYKFGVNPSDRRWHEEMKLMDNHLQDMRRLVFKEGPRP